MTLVRTTTPLDRARALFGSDLIGPDDVGRALGVEPVALASEEASLLREVPYALDILEAAHARGEVLVFRVPNDGAAPLTVLRLRERFPEAIDPKLFKGVGYLLKDEWTLDQEPFAATATCRLEWRLVHREPIPSTCNLSYELQDAALARYAESIGLESRLQRRSGIEMVYDTIMVERARGARLLARAWDWSDTPTADGGYVTAGEFDTRGLHILGYSRAVRFGTLGICAQH
jgi:hypothetical protein